MNLIERIRNLFSGKRKPEPEPAAAAPEPKKPGRMKKPCMGCGKTISYDPSWDHIPNYCRECKEKFRTEREEKQRAGAPKKIKRKCRACGRFFTFPNTLEHYPNYCTNCRKKHQAEMKARFSGKKTEKV